MSDRVKTKMNRNQLPSLKSVTSSISTPWNVYIEKILSGPYPWRSLPRKPSEGELALILYRVYAWEIALHWVIKKQWNTKHKIPAKRSLAQSFESKGEFLRQILLLCERCHAMQEAAPIDIPYPHAAYWFSLVFWELIIHEMVCAVRQREPSKLTRNKRVASPKQNPAYRKKRTQIQAEMDEVLQLQINFQNPVQENNENMKATFLLFKAAITLAQKSNVFPSGYWKQFLNAWKAQIKVKEKAGMGLVVMEDNKVYVQSGKGRGKRILSCPEELKQKFL